MSDPDIFVLVVIAGVMLMFVVVLVGVLWVFAKALNIQHQSAPRDQPQRSQYPTIRREFQQLAQLYSGKLLPGPLYELPRFTFDHQGAPVMVESQYYGAQPATFLQYHITVRFAWPDAKLRMDLSPEGLLASFQKLIGMTDIEVGDKAFDRKYMITGNDYVQVQRLLTPEVRELVNLIRGPRYNDEVNLRIVGGGMWLAKRNMPGDYEALRNLLELALALYDALLQQPRAGIEFLDSVNVDPTVAICQVCGEGIEQPEIQCTRCRTPHHRECWHYFGGCSIYGCGGKEFEPQVMTRITRMNEQDGTE